MKPLLLLDVDGVLYPYAAPAPLEGYQCYTFFDEPVWLAPTHGAWLEPLCARFQLVWATGWEHDANRLIAPILGLPRFPVIEFSRNSDGRFKKLATIVQFVAEQPLVWIDDELSSEAHAWATQRRASTLLIDVDPAVGLTTKIVAAIAAFEVR